MSDCKQDCEECEYCEVDIHFRYSHLSKVVCTRFNKEVGYVVDDLDYEGNPIQRVIYMEGR